MTHHVLLVLLNIEIVKLEKHLLPGAPESVMCPQCVVEHSCGIIQHRYQAYMVQHMYCIGVELYNMGVLPHIYGHKCVNS
jgi:hypothetical protein